MKKSLFVILSLMLAAPAFATSTMRIDLGGGEKYLDECGGTIEAKTTDMGRDQSDQINLVLRNVKNCSNFILEATGKEYKLQGSNGDRSGSYTLSAGKLDMGWNHLILTVRSNSGKHNDKVSIWIKVTPKNGRRYGSCASAAKEAAIDQTTGLVFDVSSRLLRESNRGNLVYSVTVYGLLSQLTYEVVTSPAPACNILSVK